MIRKVLNIRHLVLPHFMCTVGRRGLAEEYNEDLCRICVGAVFACYRVTGVSVSDVNASMGLQDLED